VIRWVGQSIVNGEAIDPSLIDEAFARFKATGSQARSSCCERDDGFRDLARKGDEVIEGILRGKPNAVFQHR
jgi:hypothetical protein